MLHDWLAAQERFYLKIEVGRYPAAWAPRCNRHRLLFLIDEFPSLNRMEIFADALSYMADTD
jgi:hypothetical protein